jgi:hypothetical protein
MKKPYVVHARTGEKYEVLKIDKANNVFTLKPAVGDAFEEPYDKARFEKMGYTVQVLEIAEAPADDE